VHLHQSDEKESNILKGSLRLGRIAGIDISVHFTWLFIFALITWSLAQNFFPQLYSGWVTSLYWIMAAVGAVLLFVSVLLHELAHSLVAKARGLPVGGITLFLFGGVSNLEKEPEKPGVEFWMAIVGPLTSLILAGIFWGLQRTVGQGNEQAEALLFYLALINAILAAFNLIPGFPLDGGRVLRSIIWGATGNLVKATNTASIIGQIFGWMLIGFGVYRLFSGDFVGGIWMAFIGWFLNSAASASRRDVTFREQLRGIKVRSVMQAGPESIDVQMPVRILVHDFFLQGRRRAAPVLRENNLAGIVTITDLRKVPQDRWDDTPIERIMTTQPIYSVNPDAELGSAFTLLAQHNLNQVPVLEGGRLVGMLTRADVIRYLQLSQEFGIQPPK
jgi:Zn-dependent protease